jgi:hypothetical protein
VCVCVCCSDHYHENALSKLSTIKQLRSKIEQAINERSCRLETALSSAVSLETELENANGIIAKITEFLNTLPSSNVNCSSLPKLLDDLRVGFNFCC